MSDTSGNLTVTLNKKAIVWVLVVIAVAIVAVRLVYDYAVKPAADVTVEKTGEAVKKAVELPDELAAKAFVEETMKARHKVPVQAVKTNEEAAAAASANMAEEIANGLPGYDRIFFFRYSYNTSAGVETRIVAVFKRVGSSQWEIKRL